MYSPIENGMLNADAFATILSIAQLNWKIKKQYIYSKWQTAKIVAVHVIQVKIVKTKKIISNKLSLFSFLIFGGYVNARAHNTPIPFVSNKKLNI